MYQRSLLQLTSSHDARALRAWARCQDAPVTQVRRVAGVMLLTPPTPKLRLSRLLSPCLDCLMKRGH